MEATPAEAEVALREMQVKRLEAVIAAKEARLNALRDSRASAGSPELENNPPAGVEAFTRHLAVTPSR